ncbi:MAG: sialate O-acetylesterase [Acidobacteriaceae bacterium]|nr:sialate O-acetylesterase [Acidobacteriaceae bacterium]
MLLTSLCCAAGHASVRLPHLLSDHAVLQRDRPIHVWGWASPNVRLKVALHGQSSETLANPLGEWSVYLKPESAGGPYTLLITGDGEEVKLQDLLIGDVWLASGQSNMQFPLQGFTGAPMKDQAAEIAASTHPRIRLLRVEQGGSDTPKADQPSVWKECIPENAKDFSAVAYFFGREISGLQNVPVGLIDSAYGGTPADSWLSLHAYGADASLQPALATWSRFADEQANLSDVIAIEREEDATAVREGKPKPSHPWHPFAQSWQPSALYNAMIAPLTPYAIRGFLWYQGETNSAPDRAPHYQSTLSALIRDWRNRFDQGNLPFLYVQISSFSSPSEDWAMLRDQQRRALDNANTAMSVTIDVGEATNVHPADKQTVGARLALAARHLVYGENLVSSGPLFRQATAEMNADGSKSMRVWFDDAHSLSSRGAPLSSFEVAGADHKFVPAEAAIEGDTVLVKAAAVQDPRFVRFGWSSVVESNLYNEAGLPASTFTSEP